MLDWTSNVYWPAGDKWEPFPSMNWSHLLQFRIDSLSWQPPVYGHGIRNGIISTEIDLRKKENGCIWQSEGPHRDVAQNTWRYVSVCQKWISDVITHINGFIIYPGHAILSQLSFFFCHIFIYSTFLEKYFYRAQFTEADLFISYNDHLCCKVNLVAFLFCKSFS